MKYPVVLTPGESGCIVAECPIIPGCISQGKTREEALANIADAIKGCLEVRREQGLPLTVWLDREPPRIDEAVKPPVQ
ncbi:type II toxin-antitoxin system HicB family antitoxin [bacterium]|nr:type II toxin-antitoxin system HicB family antitoxin [bacterium]